MHCSNLFPGLNLILGLEKNLVERKDKKTKWSGSEFMEDTIAIQARSPKFYLNLLFRTDKPGAPSSI